MKKALLLFFFSFLLGKVNAQAFEMVERSWAIFGDDLDSAKTLAENGYYLAQKRNDLKSMGRAMCYRAVYYDIEAITDSALFLFYKAIDIQESINDTSGLFTTYNNLGILYFHQYQYPLALSYYKKAYDIAIQLHDYSNAAGALVNMGTIESYQKDGGNALQYYAEAERLYLNENDSEALPQVWSSSSKIFFDRKEYEKAYALNLKAVEISDDYKTLEAWITERILMTNILTGDKKYQEAEKYGLEGLREAEKNNLPERKQYLYEALANLYYQKKDYEKAYTYSTKYRDLRDSLVNDTRARQIAEMETANQVERKNNEITRLTLDAEKKKNLELEKDRLEFGLYASIAGSLLGLIILGVFVFLLRRNLNLEKTNSQLLTDKKNHTEALLEKEKLLMRESHHRIKNNLQLVNSILDLQSRNIDDAAIKKAFTESRQRIQAISFAHQRLYGNDTVEKLNLKSFLGDLIQSIQSSMMDPNGHVKILMDIDDITISTEKAIPIGLIVNELLTNSIKYAFDANAPGEILISLKLRGHQLYLIISDNGKGMVGETKGTGFGHQLVKSMTRQLKAEYLLSLTLGVSHQFIIPV